MDKVLTCPSSPPLLSSPPLPSSPCLPPLSPYLLNGSNIPMSSPVPATTLDLPPAPFVIDSSWEPPQRTAELDSSYKESILATSEGSLKGIYFHAVRYYYFDFHCSGRQFYISNTNKPPAVSNYANIP